MTRAYEIRIEVRANTIIGKTILDRVRRAVLALANPDRQDNGILSVESINVREIQ